MKTVPAIYRGNRVLELSDDVHLEEDSKVIVLIPDETSAEEESWQSLTATQFLEDFEDSDSIYDNL